jgi:hypothetical protein
MRLQLRKRGALFRHGRTSGAKTRFALLRAGMTSSAKQGIPSAF